VPTGRARLRGDQVGYRRVCWKACWKVTSCTLEQTETLSLRTVRPSTALSDGIVPRAVLLLTYLLCGRARVDPARPARRAVGLVAPRRADEGGAGLDDARHGRAGRVGRAFGRWLYVRSIKLPLAAGTPKGQWETSASNLQLPVPPVRCPAVHRARRLS
jgi:hypothetical protein